MTRSRTGVFSALLPAALCAAPLRLCAQSAVAREERRLLITERDPAEAEADPTKARQKGVPSPQVEPK